MARHYITKCSRCEDVIAQCRCPSSGKKVNYDLCDACAYGTPRTKPEPTPVEPAVHAPKTVGS